MNFHQTKNVYYVVFNKDGIVSKDYFFDGRMSERTAKAKLAELYPNCECIVYKKYSSFIGDNYSGLVNAANKRIAEMNAVEEVAEETVAEETVAEETTVEETTEEVVYFDDVTLEKMDKYIQSTAKNWNERLEDRIIKGLYYDKSKKSRVYSAVLKFENYESEIKFAVFDDKRKRISLLKIA